jgi:predicted CopG family antitoxin
MFANLICTYKTRLRKHMQKKLTITMDQQVYEGLHAVIGRRNISQFVTSLVRPHVIKQDMDAAYRQMAADEERECEALEWAEATLEDVRNDPR